jgi:hypothetical protein
MEREGIEINWLTFSEIEKAKIKIANFINEWSNEYRLTTKC